MKEALEFILMLYGAWYLFVKIVVKVALISDDVKRKTIKRLKQRIIELEHQLDD